MKAEILDDLKGDSQPGAICFVIRQSSPEIVQGIEFKCPCGCGRDGYLPLKPRPSPSWEWDGNREAPTLKPSVLQVGGCRWHGWLRNGEWVNA